MKKTVKSLIIAASVAAVAGIGAVSFAAWQGGNTSTATSTGNTGNIVTVGTLTATSDLSDTVKLVPFDQEDQFDATTMKKMATIELEYTGGTGTPVYKIQLTANAGNLTLKYKIGASATAADTDFAVIPTTATEFELGENDKVFVILDSDSTTDFNKAFTITFTAEAPTVEAA